VPFWTARCSFFSPANAETGEKEIFEKNFRYSSPLSLHPTCPKIPDDPYPHLHNHTLQLPRQHALHLDRVWWTSPPAAYKYRGENKTERKGGRFFWEREERTGGQNFGEGKGGRNKRKEAETGGAGKFWKGKRGEQKTGGRSLFKSRGARAKQKKKGREGGKKSERARQKREEKSHRCTSTSASTFPPSHHRQNRCRTTITAAATWFPSHRPQSQSLPLPPTDKKKRTEHRGRKKQITEEKRRTIISLSGLSLFVVGSSATTNSCHRPPRHW